MKKTAVLALALLCLLSCLHAPAQGESFLSVTGLDGLGAALDAGGEIASVYYSDGYGFSDSGFTTFDPAECRALFDALSQVTLLARSKESVTDWYPLVLFTLSDGSCLGVRFEGTRLDLGDGETWDLSGLEDFLDLVDRYRAKYAGQMYAQEGEETELLPNAAELVFPGDGWTCTMNEGGVVSAESAPAEQGGTLFRFEGLCEGGDVVTLSRGERERTVVRLYVDAEGNVLISGVEIAY